MFLTIAHLNSSAEKNIDVIGKPSYVSYNSPFKFFSRRNEIIIEINYSEDIKSID